jgi:serine/threonine protein kinase
MSPAGPPDDQSVESLVSRLADEFVQRLDRGERPEVEDYARLHPQLARVLRQILPALAAMRLMHSGSAAAGAPPAPPALVSESLGDYRILGEIGRGGMGVVYEAEQLSLARRVALKVLSVGATLDPKQLQRFKNEALSAAQMSHPHIVPVYAVGCERGVHFYAMQLIEGQSLAAVIAGHRRDAGLSVDERGGGRVPGSADTAPLGTVVPERGTRSPAFFRTAARLGVQAAEALEHAHQMGVIHRDIKPANLIVDGQGQLWVADFGLAHCQSHDGLTMTGDLLGTIRYMSPEQTQGRPGLVDHRTDVYSLGVTLVELLTLEPAVRGQDRQELLRRIGQEEPVPPRRLNPAVPADLETVVLKAMAKNREERYGTAQELADDLRRFLNDEPIRARRPSLPQRVQKWARRHRPVVVSGGVAALTVLVLTIAGLTAGIAVIWEKQQETDKAWQAEKRAKEEAQENLRLEKRARYFYGIALADREWGLNNPDKVEPILGDCPEELRQWEWRYLNRLCHEDRFTARAHTGAVVGVAYSPDGSRLASLSDRGVKVLDAATGKELLAIERGYSTVVFSPDGRRLATTTGDNYPPLFGPVPLSAKVWDATTGRELLTLDKRRTAL